VNPEFESRPSIASSSRWILAGVLLSKPFQLATNVIVARIFGPLQFGTYSLANTTAVMLSGIGGLGFGEAIQKFLAENFRRSRDTAVSASGLAIWISMLFTFVFLVAAWFLRDLWAPDGLVGTGDSIGVFGLCLLVAFGNVAMSLSVNIFSGIQVFRIVSMLGALQALLAFALTPALGYALGIEGALIATIAGSVVCLCLAVMAIIRTDPRLLVPHPSGVRHLPQIAGVAAPTWIASLIMNPVTVLAWAYLSSQPGGGHELGLFNAANALKMLVAVLPGILGPAIAPALMEEGGRHGSEESYRRLHDDCFYALLVLGLPPTIIAIGFGDLIFKIYGADFSESYRLFAPLAAGVCIGVVNSSIQIAYVAKSKTWLLLWLTFVKVGLFLALVYWWVPTSLASGLAWAWLSSELAFAILAAMVAAKLRLVPRASAMLQAYFLIAILAFLILLVVVPATAMRVVAAVLAVGTLVAIGRLHPAALVWVEGALPDRFRGGFRRISSALARGRTA